MIVGQMAVQQKHFDECAGAVSVAVRSPGRGPPGFVDRGDLPGGAGLFECGRAGKRTGFAERTFQVVVQIQPRLRFAEQAFVAGDFGAASRLTFPQE